MNSCFLFPPYKMSATVCETALAHAKTLNELSTAHAAAPTSPVTALPLLEMDISAGRVETLTSGDVTSKEARRHSAGPCSSKAPSFNGSTFKVFSQNAKSISCSCSRVVRVALQN